jgi:hypothetical protein
VFSWAGSKKTTDFLPFLLENSVATAAKKLDIFTLSRIDYKKYLKKEIIKIRSVEVEI